MTLCIPAARQALSLWSAAAPVEPPSGRVVAAVLQFGDVREARADGTTLVRFSPARLEREDMELLLADERGRALDVSLVWDEPGEWLMQVLDVGPLRAQAQAGPAADRAADTRMRGFPHLRAHAA